ncbi:hypothetical protein SAMN05216188_101885 [Lentzea xinjiangensis]|uniref:DUF3558 domain-containing protein n=1 Tax=Lentzea xinjiangensis TaxID=402600 RepID=A0A1H9BQE4_9PSEU|nr:hypothetical protein [Lentzea xinjiangensis]SEP91204.1 hypothetical protein SAMN05216188_101885 [Lentzea xinjiangensis]
MNQPPPHGWHQQPPPPGWPQPQPPHGGQQPPPGWGPPQPGWGPPRPPGKSKAPLVAGIIAGVLVLGGAATALVLHLDANADSGSSKRSDRLPSLCGNISEAALAKARTTNPNGLASRETKLPSGTRTICSWNQTKGVDGSGLRSTDVHVSRGQEEAETEFDRLVAQNMANNQGTPQQKPLDGLGDRATAVLVETDSAFTEISVIVRKGDAIVEVDLSGWDAGFFGNTKPDVAELEAAARGVADEMVAKL